MQEIDYEAKAAKAIFMLERTRDYLNELRNKMDYEIAEAMPNEVRAEIDAIREKFKAFIDAAERDAALLELEAKAQVLAHGATVKGAGLMAVYNKGRKTWDGGLLSGYAIAHPEVLACQKEGEPSVSIRGIK